MGSIDIDIPSSPGKRLLHTTIDELAVENPTRAWASIPKTTNLSDGFRDISYRCLANAINRMAWFLKSHLGAKDFESFAYIGKPDCRYHIISMAAAKTGYKALFTSHMNSLAGHLNIMSKCDCRTILTSGAVMVDDIVSARKMRHIVVPDLDDVLDESPVPHYSYGKTFEQAKNDPYLILHTSGSTGLPKPIMVPHAWYAAVDRMKLIPGYEQNDTFLPPAMAPKKGKPSRIYISFVPFHMISAIVMMIDTVFGNATLIFGPAERILTSLEMVDLLNNTDVDMAFVGPVVIEELAKLPDAVEKLSKLDSILYGGGTISEEAGIRISSATKLANVFGTTESGPAICHYVESEDWNYVNFDSYYNGFEWRHYDENLYEPVVINKPETRQYQPIFTIYPDLHEWSMEDLWSKHPTKPGLLHYEGRIDDLICFGHGNKFHPIGLETRLAAHPSIRSALAFGEHRMQAALLIEPPTYPPTEEERAKMMDDVWAAVEQANEDLPSIARIARSHIMFAKKEKPFLRAGKGTVQRRMTINLYQDEINDLYERMGDHGAPMVTRVIQTE